MAHIARVPQIYDPSGGPLNLLGPVTLGYGGPWSNVADLPFTPRMMHVSVEGNIHYAADGVLPATRFENTEAFEIGWHPCGFLRIYVLNTTATLTVWV